MDEGVIKRLEDHPQYLNNVCNDFNKLVLDYTDKQKSNAALKTLIELYRLLEKPEWKSKVDAELLCKFSSHLCQFIKNITQSEIQKYLATICNIHRCVVKKKAPVNLSLQLAKCVFSHPNVVMSSEYNKIYWIILVDCMSAIESVKDKSSNVCAKIGMEIVIKVCGMAQVQFCKENLVWLLKKFFLLFNSSAPRELGCFFEKLFNTLCHNKNMVNSLGAESEYEFYKSALYCCAIVHQNIVSCGFRHGHSLAIALKFSMNLFESESEHFHLIRAISALVPILTTNLSNTSPQAHNLVVNFIKDIDLTEEINYTDASKELCSILRKMLNLCLSYWVTVEDEFWKNNFPINLQNVILNLTILITKVLRQSNTQVVKCVTCGFKSAIHDSIPLGCFAGLFASKSAKCGMDITILTESIEYTALEQMKNLNSLHMNGCPNWKTFWSKMENDLHNLAILLYSLNFYEHSHRIFKLYVSIFTRVLNWDKTACDLNHLSRAFYNMAICQSDLGEQYEALIGCYVSKAINSAVQVHPAQEMVHTNFVIQIKSKVYSTSQTKRMSASCKEERSLNSQVDDEMENDKRQCDFEKLLQLTVWSACNEFVSLEGNSIYSKLFSTVDFGELLLSELEVYLKVWPSSVLMVGICQSLQNQCQLASPLCKSATNIDCSGMLSINRLTIISGKVVTLITTQSAKLNNPKLFEFVKVTLKFLENYFKKILPDDKSDDIVIPKLLLANTLLSYSLCETRVKRKLGAQNIVAEVTPVSTYAPHQPPLHPDDACDVAPTHQYLSLKIEHEIIQPIYQSIKLWREAVTHIGLAKDKFILNETFKTYMDRTVEIIEMACQVLALHDIDVASLHCADMAHFLSVLTGNRICTLRSAGFLLESAACPHITLEAIICNTNAIARGILESDDKVPEDPLLIEATFEYLLNLSVYYYHIGLKSNGFIILNSINNRILAYYLNERSENKRKLEDIKISYAKLIAVQSLYSNFYQERGIKQTQNFMGILTCLVNAHMECGDLVKSNTGSSVRVAAVTQRLWLSTGMEAGRVALGLGLVRRARALVKAPLAAAQKLLLPRRTTQLLILLAAADLAAERHDDCMVKLDGIRYILGEHNNMKITGNFKVSEMEANKVQNTTSKKCLLLSKDMTGDAKQFEMVLDVSAGNPSLGGSPTFHPTPFVLPDFVGHRHTCDCNKCSSVSNFVIYLDFMRIQAQLHFKTGESRVTGTFYNGGLKLAKYLRAKLKYIHENNVNLFLQAQFGNVTQTLNNNKFIIAECQLLTDANYFFITESETDKALKYNTEVLAKLEKSDDYFLIQLAKEQRMFLSQIIVFRKESENQSQLDVIDDLQRDFNSKMILTPEKKQTLPCFLTPHDKKISAVNRVKRNLGNTLPSTRKNEFTDFVRPAIKLSLDDDDDEEITKSKSAKVSDKIKYKSINNLNPDILKTPTPRIKNEKKMILSESAIKIPKTRAKTNLNTSKKPVDSNSCGDPEKESKLDTSIFPTTSSGAPKIRVYGNQTKKKQISSSQSVESEILKTVASQSVKRTVKPKEENKTIAAPDAVKKYSTRRRL